MPWRETDAMQERLRFIDAYESGLWSMTELCERFSISRDTGYRLLSRYRSEGFGGLLPRSRAPKSCPHRMCSEVQALLLQCRETHPTWGPRKIRVYLARKHPELSLPAASTIGDLLQREGLIQMKRRRRKWPHPGSSPLHSQAPNEVWTADFKGEFRTADGLYCYPLTVADAHTRYLLSSEALLSTKSREAKPVFERLFRTYGLPERIRTDNGVPFSTPALCGLSHLSVWWIKLGIRHERIEPASPQQNGAHERMHRTLKAETTRPPERNQMAQQARFDCFRREYNEERPHEALQMQTPASAYQHSSRPMPHRLQGPEYPGHFEVRRVSRAGTFRLKSRQLFLSNPLKEEVIGLEETEDGIWSIHFYGVLLARIDERDGILRP